MKPGRPGLTTLTIVLLIIGALVVTGGAFFLTGGGNESREQIAADLFEVHRGDFDITIPASGELAALRQTEIASRLESRATIVEIVDEGTLVKEGDVLIRLNDDEIVERIKDAEDDVQTAEAAWVAAKSNLDIHKEASASQLAQADVEVKLAELALRAWQEGEDVSQRQTLELDVETTKKDYDRLSARFEQSKTLLEKQFISQDEYSQDEIEMIRARSRWQQAQLALEVYEKYTAEEQLERLQSDLKQAQDRRSETRQRNENELRTLEADLQSKAFRMESRRERLADLNEQQELCTIRAPQDGLVIYASSLSSGRWGRGGDENPPQVGTELPRNRTVMILPDTSQMVAEVKVNEALSGRIEAGQLATVYSDALPGRPLAGEVIGVGVLAEGGSWRDPNRRDYTVRVRLVDGEGLGLKPSMRCKAEIKVGRVDDALFVPIQAVFRRGPVAFVYLPDGSGYRPQIVKAGRSSELYMEVREGLEEGDVVLLREPTTSELTVDVDSVIDPAARNGRTRRPGAGGPGGGARPAGPQGAEGGAERSRGGASGSERPHRGTDQG